MNKIDRPKIDIPKTLIEKTLDIITIILFILSLLYVFMQWNALPAEIPAHYDGKGEVDRWGSKVEMIILPIIGIVMWIGLSILEKYPHVYNYINLTEDNAYTQYKNGRLLVNSLKNLSTLIFAYILWSNVQIALGNATHLAMAPMIILLASMFFISIFSMYKSAKL